MKDLKLSFPDCPVASKCQDLPGMGLRAEDVDIPIFPYRYVNDWPKWV